MKTSGRAYGGEARGRQIFPSSNSPSARARRFPLLCKPMTPADRIGQARALLLEAEALIGAARFEAHDIRAELGAEIAVLRRSQERLAAARRRILKTGWGKFLRHMAEAR